MPSISVHLSSSQFYLSKIMRIKPFKHIKNTPLWLYLDQSNYLWFTFPGLTWNSALWSFLPIV